MPLNLEAVLIRWGVVFAIGAALFGLGWIKGATHEQTKAAAFQGGVEALGKSAAARKVTVEGLQGKVVENVTLQAKSATAASDAYWLRQSARSSCGSLPIAAATPGSAQPAAPPAEPNPPRCSEADGAADAIQVIELQRFYQGLIEAQKDAVIH